MRKYIIAIAFAVTIIMFPAAAGLAEEKAVSGFADEQLDIRLEIQKQIDNADINNWQSAYDNMLPEASSIWGTNDVEDLISDIASGETAFNEWNIFDMIALQLKNVFASKLSLLLKLVGIALLSGLIGELGKTSTGGTNEALSFICYCFAIFVVILNFKTDAQSATRAIGDISKFIQITFPVLFTLLSAMGSLASAGVFQPAMAFLSSTVEYVLQRIVMPLIMSSAVFGIFNEITGRVQLGNLYSLFKSAVKWIIGFVFTLYVGIVTFGGMSANAADGVSVKITKFAVDKFVPIVGGVLSGTVDTVLGCALLVKNAAGLAAMIILFGTIAAPLISLATSIFTYKIAAALCEPVCGSKMTKMFYSVSEVLTYMFAAIAAIGIMFAITVGLIIGTGNINIM